MKFLEKFVFVLLLVIVPLGLLFGMEIGITYLAGYTLTLMDLVYYGVANAICYAMLICLLE